LKTSKVHGTHLDRKKKERKGVGNVTTFGRGGTEPLPGLICRPERAGGNLEKGIGRKGLKTAGANTILRIRGEGGRAEKSQKGSNRFVGWYVG